jgi:recombination protein RecA
MSKLDKNEVLSVISDIEKKFGTGSIIKLSDRPTDAPHISTGSIGLDSALGIGGLPYGRIVEIYGDTGTGKSGITLSAIANAQRAGKRCAVIDTEHALDPAYAELLGVDVNELFISQPDDGDSALEICEMLIKSNKFGLVVVDSVAGLVPRRELDGDFGDANVGVMAKMMAQAMRKFAGAANKSHTCIVFTNQIRDNIGAFGYADTSITTGGKSLKFFASVRIELKRMQQVKTGDDVTGHKVKATVKKNKLAAPFKTAEYEITYNQNAVKLNEIADLGVEYKFIEKTGAWFSVNEQRFQGKDKLRTYLSENPNVADELEKKIRGFLGVLDAE